MGQDATEIRREIEATRARMGDTVEAIGYKADVPARLRDNVNDHIESVKGTISGAFSGAKDTVLGTTQSISETAAGKVGGMQDVTAAAVKNPLGIAVGALAVGMLAGLLVPISDIERAKLTPISDDVTSRAQTAVSEAVEAGKTVLAEAAGSVAQSAQDKGKTIAEHALQGTPLAPASDRQGEDAQE